MNIPETNIIDLVQLFFLTIDILIIEISNDYFKRYNTRVSNQKTNLPFTKFDLMISLQWGINFDGPMKQCQVEYFKLN